MMRTAFFLIAALWLGVAAKAETDKPYAGQEARAIKSLSEDRIAGLRAGAGLGYAKAAELNGFPGPRHVLELADELDLSKETVAQVEAVFRAMQEDAQALGAELIAAEAELDALFAGGDVAAEAVRAATAKVAQIESQLRAAHLVAHLETTPLLNHHQLMIYSQKRGYGAGHHGHSNH